MKRRKAIQRIMACITAVAVAVGILPVGYFSDTIAKAATTQSSTLFNPVIDENGVTTWDCIYFGNYYQSDVTGTTKEPIKWRVLSVDGDDAFLVADMSLDVQPYNKSYTDITWEDCTLRSWLNGYGSDSNIDAVDYSSDNFIDTAFTEEEQKAILTTELVNTGHLFSGSDYGNDTQDKIFLLSDEDLINKDYGFNSKYATEDNARKVQNTAYVMAGNPMTPVEKGFWWLRDLGRTTKKAAYVNTNGVVKTDGSDVYGRGYVVRPALYINLNAISENSSYVWEYAGSVTSEEEKVVSITLEEASVELIEGDTYQISATVCPETTTESNTLLYTSDNEDVVTVDIDGKITALKEGNAVITITSEANANIQRTCNVIVYRDYNLSNPVTDENTVTTWDTIYFGNYYQNDVNGITKEPIKWRILSVDGNDAFLISDKVLDYQSYNTSKVDVTWEVCTMRSWLNGYGSENNVETEDYCNNSFIDTAFTEQEQEAILTTKVINNNGPVYCADGGNKTYDKVYLLSTSEISKKYGFTSSFTSVDKTREVQNTAYAEEKNTQDSINWWLRTTGTYLDSATIVDSNGQSNIYLSVSAIRAVRPVLHLNLAALNEDSEYMWKYAGKVTSEGEVIEPGGSTDPIEPSDPETEPIETEPTEPVEPSDPEPIDPVEPSDPETEPSVPEPTDPVEPTDPKPTEPIDYGLSNPITNEEGITTWDTIYFGNYYQSDVTGTIKEPIKWRVLSVDGDEAFLISDMNLDSQPYNVSYADIGWEDCTLRSWLNGYGNDSNVDAIDYRNNNFIDTAFTEEEQTAILTTEVVNNSGENTADKIYLLSKEEATNALYGFSNNLSTYEETRSAQNTAYAARKGIIMMPDGSGNWWLRSKSKASYGAMNIGLSGYIDTDWSMVINGITGAVRPVLHLNLATLNNFSYIWEYAGKVTSEEKNVISITLQVSSVGLQVGDKWQMISTVFPEKATDKAVIYTSDNEEAVTVDENGKVTAVKEGVAMITVTSADNPNIQTVCNITVMKSHGLFNPSVDENGVTTWDTVYFGNYYQSDTAGMIKEPIKWRVLYVDGEDAFLMADKTLDYQPYNTNYKDVTWETCTLRSWLNGYGSESNIEATDYSNNSFIDTAFTEEEQQVIVPTKVSDNDDPLFVWTPANDTEDKIYLLTTGDTVNTLYGFSSSLDAGDKARKAQNTAYAAGRITGADAYADWWLRKTGLASGTCRDVLESGYVYSYASVFYSSVTKISGVRPVLHLNLSVSGNSSALWEYAGKVTSENESVTSVILEEASVKMQKNSTYQINAEAYPKTATENQTLIYTSDNEEVASIDATGVVTALKAGIAVITIALKSNPYVCTTCNIVVMKELSNPVTDEYGVTTWDTIYFGNYYQSDGSGKTKEPVRWRVLSVDGDDAFLLADMNLDSQPYNTNRKDVTWENCTLRSWLNGYGSDSNIEAIDYSSNNFIDTAFTESEQTAIMTTDVENTANSSYGTPGGNNTQDKIYLLSINEAADTAYGFKDVFNVQDNARMAQNTAYAIEQGANTYKGEYDGNGYWWLRTPGANERQASYIAYYGFGVFRGERIEKVYQVVRPVLHLKLLAADENSSLVWEYAGKVTSEDKHIIAIKLEESSMKLPAGDGGQIAAYVYPSITTEDKSLLYISDNEEVATVSETGYVTALKKGTATITIKSVSHPNLQKICRITVEEEKITEPTEPTTSPTDPPIQPTESTHVLIPVQPTDTLIQSTVLAPTVQSVTACTALATDTYYTGKACETSVVVKNGSTTLQKGVDYQLIYKNNVKPGKATVTVVGIGKYTGVKEVTFNIKVRKNTTFTSGALKYKVLSVKNNKGNVTVTGLAKKNSTKVAVPATAKLGNYTFNVTKIAAKAFRNSKKLKNVTIGKNVTEIGTKAFENCKKLKKVDIKTTKLKKAGKNLFKGTKANVKAPAKYKKLLNK